MKVTPEQIRQLVESTINEMDPRTSHTVTYKTGSKTLNMYSELRKELEEIMLDAARALQNPEKLQRSLDDARVTIDMFKSEAMNDFYRRSSRNAQPGDAEEAVAMLAQHIDYLASNVIGGLTDMISLRAHPTRAHTAMGRAYKALDHIETMKDLIDQTIDKRRHRGANDDQTAA